ncbi:3-hydroxyisobutyryl-CoA hydrolase 1 [Rhynchospora pubera]|uniref:3-hydroxyisobutyryl-CoA hydrolase n=1 Tax=Rhynchospora pubera TaxID=906938 RepID=A0AAV8H1D5_9POAL|nr:3-hydroxyisobutyryl-CoA hydrolase 1 [Rhynchospora pubera]
MASPSYVRVLEDLNQITAEGDSHARTITLNRPSKLNAMGYQMIVQLTDELLALEKKPNFKILIVKGKGRAFSAGGDNSGIWWCMTEGDWSFGSYYYKKYVTLNHIMSTFKLPSVFISNGIVMGAGAGFYMNGRFRVATENTVFAMPETQIGLFPDAGASYFLSRLPGLFGEYIGLTGTRLDGSEMVACGLATHYVSSKNLRKLEESLNKIDTDDPSIIDKIISQHEENPSLREGCSLLNYHRSDTIDKCFSKGSVEEIIASLEQEFAVDPKDWIASAIKTMKRASPANLKIFLRSIRQGRNQTYEECIQREYIMFSHAMRRTITGDVFEGVAAKLIDKNVSPKWDPLSLGQVTNKMVEKCFCEIKDDDWPHLNLPSRSNSIATTLLPSRL